jgi:uncharacterized RDD family membrane protein YckC|tara:strand:- start:5114 stop:5578 length:465 start_codon:yes stop_codon:yes gene_type:complete
MNKEVTKLKISANIFRRLMAMLYDSLLLVGIIFAFGVIVFILRRLAGDDTLQAPNDNAQSIIILGMWLSCASFYVWCWHRNGQTLGMKSWRLQLQDHNQKPLSWRKCWLRCILAHISFTSLGVGYLWCIIDKEGRCLHDIFSQTKIIVLVKKIT